MSDELTDAPLTHPEEMKGTVEFKLGNLATDTSLLERWAETISAVRPIIWFSVMRASSRT